MSVFLIESASEPVLPFTHSAASDELPQRLPDVVRTNPEHAEKRAHVLEFLEPSHAGGSGIGVIRGERHVKRGAGARNRPMDIDCSFLCHSSFFFPFSPLRCLPL